MRKEPGQWGERPQQESPTAGLADSLREFTHNFEELMADHLKLARVELIADAKSSLKKLGGAAAIAVGAFVGYLLLMIGISFLLARAIGPSGGFLVIGLLHLVGAAVGGFYLYRATKRMTAPMPESREEMGRTVAATKAALSNDEGGRTSVAH